MGVYANNHDGTLTTLANGTRMWVGTREAYELNKDNIPNNALVSITDDEDSTYVSDDELTSRMANEMAGLSGSWENITDDCTYSSGATLVTGTYGTVVALNRNLGLVKGTVRFTRGSGDTGVGNQSAFITLPTDVTVRWTGDYGLGSYTNADGGQSNGMHISVRGAAGSRNLYSSHTVNTAAPTETSGTIEYDFLVPVDVGAGSATPPAVAPDTFLTDTPIGTIIPYGGTDAPTDFLLCNGQAVSRTEYAELFAVIGTAFGSGDNSTTFNVPDLREATVKGIGLSGKSSTHYDSNGLDLGEFIDDRIKSHHHTITSIFSPGSATTTYVAPVGGSSGEMIKVADTGSATNEVKAVGVNYIIKAKTTSIGETVGSYIDDRISNTIKSVTASPTTDSSGNMAIHSYIPEGKANVVVLSVRPTTTDQNYNIGVYQDPSSNWYAVPHNWVNDSKVAGGTTIPVEIYYIVK